MPVALAEGLRTHPSPHLVRLSSRAIGRGHRRGLRVDPVQCRARRFEAQGLESLFGLEGAKHSDLPPAVRGLIVDVKAEYPAFTLNELVNACYVLFSRRPDHKSVRRVLTEEPLPVRMWRRFVSYHEIPER